MWTAERNRNLRAGEPIAELGTVTLGGDPAGVSLGGERRWIGVYGPGGYSWRPAAGDKVLVLKAGAEGEAPCLLGVSQKEAELKPGEVRLSGGGSALHLGQSRLSLSGQVYINGSPLEDQIRQLAGEIAREIVQEALAECGQ